MNLRLVQRRTIWWPTFAGWTCMLALACGTTALWWFEAESFFSTTQRQPGADVLVVESWIGLDGLHAAKSEFERGGYRYLVSAGGLSDNVWDTRRWNLADEGHEDLIRWGLPPDKVLVANSRDPEAQRTFATAIAAWRALRTANIRPRAINVFTLGPHARRSRLIFAKVFAPDVPVGVISCRPTAYKDEPWWHSSDRAQDLIKETVGYLFEVLLNSGRTSNSPALQTAPGAAKQP